MNKSPSLRRVILNLLCIGALLSTGFSTIADGYWGRKLHRYGAMNLPVEAVVQSRLTSCGEAAIVMAHNYAYPEARISEREVIAFAAEYNYYNERYFPYTSPDNMLRIAEYYSDTVLTGHVDDTDKALDFLIATLTAGYPVIIDIRTRLYDPGSGAHFVVVTGLEYDPDNPNATRIYYNDPMLKDSRSSYWLGQEGIWNAWMNNGDPGGAGWWMMIYSP